MNAKLLAGLAICLVGPLCAGCATGPGVIRGQSPASAPPSAAVMPANGVPMGAPAVGPECACNDGSCSNCGLPKHFLFTHYVGPEKGCCLDGCGCCGCCCLKNGCCLSMLPDCLTNRGPLVYPQNPTPGAIVQYPYYICKGPDDFFYQK